MLRLINFNFFIIFFIFDGLLGFLYEGIGFGLYLLVSLYIFVFIFEVLIFGISLKKFFIYEYKFFCMGFVVYLVMLYGDVDELLVFGVRGWCWLYINV